MKMRWMVAMLVGLALLTSQAVSLTISGLKMTHVTSAFAQNNDNQGQNNDNQGQDYGSGGSGGTSGGGGIVQ